MSSPLMVSNDDCTLRFTIPCSQELRQVLMPLYVHTPSYKRSTCVVECPSHYPVSLAQYVFHLPMKLVSNR
jgi:hypothetical protein